MALTQIPPVMIDGEMGLEWESSIKTSDFTAVAGIGYFINTTSGDITVTLPSSPSVGDSVGIVDYAGTASTNSILLTSSNNIQGDTGDRQINYTRGGVRISYSNATQGWLATGATNSNTNTLPLPPNNLQYFNPFTWQGNGQVRSITGVGFAPDMVWLKSRNQPNYNPKIMDSIRGNNGGSVMENLYTSLINVQANDNGFTSLDPDGFSLNGTGDGNQANEEYIGWCFKGGGSSNIYNIDDVGYASASAAGLNTGTIIPSGASVNTSRGFSMITYTGVYNATDTIPHGLGKVPTFVIIKNYTGGFGQAWAVYNSANGATKIGYLNYTNAFTANASYWNNTTPTNGLVTIGQAAEVSWSGQDFIMYSWADIAGLQKVGYYNSTYPTPHTENVGFQPRFVIIKSESHARNWVMYDSGRGSDYQLYANLPNSEYNSGTQFQFTSTGFTVQGGSTDLDGGSDYTYIYLAIA